MIKIEELRRIAISLREGETSYFISSRRATKNKGILHSKSNKKIGFNSLLSQGSISTLIKRQQTKPTNRIKPPILGTSFLSL